MNDNNSIPVNFAVGTGSDGPVSGLYNWVLKNVGF